MLLSLPAPHALTRKDQLACYKFTETAIQDVKQEAATRDDQTVTVIIDETKFNFDSLLLERNVGYFRKIIRQQSFSARKNGNKHIVLELREPKKVSIDAFRVIATDFLKNKEVGLNVNKVGKVLTAATYLEIPQLREACHHFIALRPGSVTLSDVMKNKKSKLSDMKPAKVKKRKKLLKYQTCRKKSKHKSQLSGPLVTHIGQRSFECHICHKSFTRKSYMKLHIRTHTDERPFTCHICHKAFAVSGALKSHLKLHSGHKPFECSVCHKAFARSGDFKRHLLTHTDQKPFKCSICHQAFTQSGYLKRHLLTHTGQKPVYNEAVTHSGILKPHLLTHTQSVIRHSLRQQQGF